MKTPIEYASAGRGALSAYQGLARWAGVSFDTVIEHAEAGRLGELIERRQLVRPRRGTEALRQIDARRYAPGDKPLSPHAVLGELRGLMAIWDEEAAEAEHQRRRRDPLRLLPAMYADRLRWVH